MDQLFEQWISCGFYNQLLRIINVQSVVNIALVYAGSVFTTIQCGNLFNCIVCNLDIMIYI